MDLNLKYAIIGHLETLIKVIKNQKPGSMQNQASILLELEVKLVWEYITSFF